MSRRKQAALAVPLSGEEATATLADYVAASRVALEQSVHYEMAIDQLKRDRAEMLAVIEAEQAPRFAALKAWWEAGGNKMALDRRSAEIAGAKIGVRLTTPKVKLPGTAEALIDWLGRVVGGNLFLRRKVELDKQAIIKAFQSEEAMATIMHRDQGVAVVQTDEFFIDTGLDPEAVRKAIVGELAAG